MYSTYHSVRMQVPTIRYIPESKIPARSINVTEHTIQNNSSKAEQRKSSYPAELSTIFEPPNSSIDVYYVYAVQKR